MIRLVKKDGSYFLQERTYKVVSDPWWMFWRNRVKIVWSEWRTAETVDLDEESQYE